MEFRKATAAVIGAGDYIGGAIVKKFASEGFTVFAGRRHGDKLAPLVAEAYWQIYQEPRDAWSFEREIRPFAEKW